MNIAEAFAASCLFMAIQEKILELLLVDQDDNLLDKKYDLEQNPIALCIGFVTYFQTATLPTTKIYLWVDFGDQKLYLNTQRLSSREKMPMRKRLLYPFA